MTGLEIGGVGFVALLVLLALRIPIGVAMLAVGMIGYTVIAGLPALLSHLKTDMYWRFTTYALSVLPLFVLMGQFAAKAGLSQALFRAANVWLGHHRGGIAMAAVGGCAGLFVGVPVPVVGPVVTACLGTFLGALGVTWLETRSWGQSARVGWGVMLARATAIALKVGGGVVLLLWVTVLLVL